MHRESNLLFVLSMKMFSKAALFSKIEEIFNTALTAQSAKNRKAKDLFEFS